MKVHLNVNLSHPKALDKTLSPSKQFDVTLKEETSLLFPSILVTGKLTDFHKYNYGYIPSFDRYYFIDGITSVTNKLVMISFKVDPLMSRRDKLKKCPVYVLRQENKYNTFFFDEKYPELVYNNTIIKKFPEKFGNQPSYFLALRG